MWKGMEKVAFIGVGNMGGALARAACKAVGPDRVVLANRTAAKASALAAELGCAVAKDSQEAVRMARYVFLCVKPQGMGELLRGTVPTLSQCHEAGEDKVLVSVAAGLRLDSLQAELEGAGYRVPLFRVMPNTCVAIGRGMTALCAREGEDEAHVRGVEEILRETGQVERLPEHMMDRFTAVAGCGPAFVYPFIEALADGGVAAGLPRGQALAYAAQTVLGAAAMVLETGKHPGQLKDEVCSPGGSTIAGVAELERRGFRGAAMDAVLAAWRRNIELGG